MKLLVDMDLTPRWVAVFHAAGFGAVYWADVGDVRASDTEIIAYANANNCIVFTRDTDYPSLLAASGASQPSVVLVRVGSPNPEDIGDLVIDALVKLENELNAGAVLTIEPARARVHLLPLR